MLDCYQQLGYTHLVANVERVYQFNYPPNSELASDSSKHWWKFWRRSPKPPTAATPATARAAPGR